MIKKFIILFLAIAALGLIAHPLLKRDVTTPLYPIFDSEGMQAPRNFRTVQGHGPLHASLNLEGLANLRASGSGQFSEFHFIELIRHLAIPPDQLIVFDLRQESHGFVNGIPISWTDGIHNYGNRNKTKIEIEMDECERLRLALQSKKLEINPIKCPVPLAVSQTQTERTLVEQTGAQYVRLPITDHNRPSDQIIDQFVALVQTLPADRWVHFHCRAGKGRTTTFLTLLDILKNGRRVSLRDILTRQWSIGGANLSYFPHKKGEEKRAAEERLAFLQKFYLYSNQVQDFRISWSEWLRKQEAMTVHSSSRLPISIDQLSLEEKVGQVLMAHFHGTEANEEARQLIQEVGIGGVIYYDWANELYSPEQVLTLSNQLQASAQNTPHRLPLLIAADQEGGRVNRLKRGFTLFPGNYALGLTQQLEWGRESARMMGQELKAVGISVNLAPVLDIYTHPANPVIGIRAFSADPREVAVWGQLALRGYQEAGIIAALKHFPGHGDVTVDSHEALPVIAKPLATLQQEELLPFRALSASADLIMTGHLLAPALDPQTCTTFSKRIVQELLREEMGFQGVIMTDSLAMQGLLSSCSSVEEAALKSLQAGHDLVLLGGKQLLASQKGLEWGVDEVKRVHRFLVEAVKEGRLSAQRLDESVARLLALKEKAGLFKPTNLSFGFICPLDRVKASNRQNCDGVHIKKYGPHRNFGSARAFTQVQRADKPKTQVTMQESLPLEKRIDSSQHRDLAKQIAWNALRLIKGRERLSAIFSQIPSSAPFFQRVSGCHALLNLLFPPLPKYPLMLPRPLIVAPEILREEMEKTSWATKESGFHIFYVEGKDSDLPLIDLLGNATPSFFFASNLWRSPDQQAIWQRLIAKTIPLRVAIVVGDPLDVKYLEAADILLSTFSPVAASLQAAFHYLLLTPPTFGHSGASNHYPILTHHCQP